MERIAFFDVDGTLVKGYYIIDFPEYLHRENIFDNSQLDVISRNFSLYKNGQLSYYDLGKNVGEAYAKGISGISKNDIEKAGKMFIRNNPERIYPFTENLLN